MSECKRTIRETEYRDTDFMAEIRKIMVQRGTGEMVLNMSQGRICSIVWREKTTEVAGVNGNLKLALDRGAAG
jgi:hypothetical protein